MKQTYIHIIICLGWFQVQVGLTVYLNLYIEYEEYVLHIYVLVIHAYSYPKRLARDRIYQRTKTTKARLVFIIQVGPIGTRPIATSERLTNVLVFSNFQRNIQVKTIRQYNSVGNQKGRNNYHIQTLTYNFTENRIR